jgi:hypothetical protein
MTTNNNNTNTTTNNNKPTTNNNNGSNNNSRSIELILLDEFTVRMPIILLRLDISEEDRAKEIKTWCDRVFTHYIDKLRAQCVDRIRDAERPNKRFHESRKQIEQVAVEDWDITHS